MHCNHLLHLNSILTPYIFLEHPVIRVTANSFVTPCVKSVTSYHLSDIRHHPGQEMVGANTDITLELHGICIRAATQIIQHFIFSSGFSVTPATAIHIRLRKKGKIILKLSTADSKSPLIKWILPVGNNFYFWP